MFISVFMFTPLHLSVYRLPSVEIYDVNTGTSIVSL